MLATDGTDAGADMLLPDELVLVPVDVALGTDPEPPGERLLGAGVATDGTDGVGTVGVWIGATGIGGGLGGWTAGTVGVGSACVDTVGVGTETVGTVTFGTETVGTAIVVGTVSAGLEVAATSTTAVVAPRIPPRVRGTAPRVHAPARLASRRWTPLQPPVIAG